MIAELIEKILIIACAAATLLWWLRYNCLLILDASSGPPPPRVRKLLARLQRTRRSAAVRPLLILLHRECRAPLVERCRLCGAACVCDTCERALLLANFVCLTACCLVVSLVSVAHTRPLTQELARIAGCLAQREPAPLALQ